MKLLHKEEIKTEQIVIDDIICNKCGCSCSAPHPGYEGLLEYSIEGGYASKLGDGIRYEFSVCVSCLLEFFKSFKIKPKVYETGWLVGDVIE